MAGPRGAGLVSYLRARYYDSATAQFVSRDSITGTTRQPYAYVVNNPLNRVDPSGHDARHLDENLCRGSSLPCEPTPGDGSSNADPFPNMRLEADDPLFQNSYDPNYNDRPVPKRGNGDLGVILGIAVGATVDAACTYSTKTPNLLCHVASTVCGQLVGEGEKRLEQGIYDNNVPNYRYPNRTPGYGP
jgi:hypothetical protein